MKHDSTSLVAGSTRSLALLLLLAGSCASTSRARSVEPSGFLESYAALEAGEGDAALLTYRNRDADLSGYERVLIEPVVAYAREGGGLAELDDEQVRALIDYFERRSGERSGPSTPSSTLPVRTSCGCASR